MDTLPRRTSMIRSMARHRPARLLLRTGVDPLSWTLPKVVGQRRDPRWQESSGGTRPNFGVRGGRSSGCGWSGTSWNKLRLCSPPTPKLTMGHKCMGEHVAGSSPLPAMQEVWWVPDQPIPCSLRSRSCANRRIILAQSMRNREIFAIYSETTSFLFPNSLVELHRPSRQPRRQPRQPDQAPHRNLAQPGAGNLLPPPESAASIAEPPQVSPRRFPSRGAPMADSRRRLEIEPARRTPGNPRAEHQVLGHLHLLSAEPFLSSFREDFHFEATNPLEDDLLGGNPPSLRLASGSLHNPAL